MTTSGQQLRDQGITDVLAADTAPHRGYGDMVRDVIERTPPGVRFSADDVRDQLPADARPHHPNVMPSVFGVLASAGVIRRVGDVNAARRSRHGSRISVWVRA